MIILFSRENLKYNLLILVLFVSLSYVSKKYFVISGPLSFVFFLIIALCLLMRGYALTAQRPQKIHVLYSFIPLLLLFVYIGIELCFGIVDFSAIVSHLEMGLGGGYPEGLMKILIRFSICFVGIVTAFVLLINLDVRFLKLDRMIFIPLLLVNPLLWGIADYLLVNRYDDRLLQAYHAPDDLLLAGDAKKNMIIIYAESAERTFADISFGEISFAEMSEIAKSGIELRGIRQATNTGWSMAGFITTQCGIPLQPRGLLSGNMFDQQISFYSGLSCLSDVVKNNGYHNEFMNGGDHGFAGMSAFLSSHNYDQVSGIQSYDSIDAEYRNSWGLFDDTLFEQATLRLRQLTEAKKPFVMSLVTIGGHFPDGHPTKSCERELKGHNLPPILYAIKCMGFEIDRFLVNLRRDGLLENTIVVVVSDHLMMKNQFEDELNLHDRMNYFAVIGADIRQQLITRDAAMFDVFPTLLDLLGFDLDGGRAGLGVSLLSDNKTMVETQGIKMVNDAIRNDRFLARKAWMKSENTLVGAL